MHPRVNIKKRRWLRVMNGLLACYDPIEVIPYEDTVITRLGPYTWISQSYSSLSRGRTLCSNYKSINPVALNNGTAAPTPFVSIMCLISQLLQDTQWMPLLLGRFKHWLSVGFNMDTSLRGWQDRVTGCVLMVGWQRKKPIALICYMVHTLL